VVVATVVEGVDLEEEQREEDTEDLEDLLSSRVSSPSQRRLKREGRWEKLTRLNGADAGPGGMRDGQPPPESAAEKIKKQILKVGDGLVSLTSLSVVPSFPFARAD